MAIIKKNEKIKSTIRSKSLEQKKYDKTYGKKHKIARNKYPSNLPDKDMSLSKNPVITFGFKALGGEFYNANGGVYGPGTPLYDKNNGEYHTHYNGQICAGKHTPKLRTMNKNMFLTPIKPEEFKNSTRIRINPIQPSRPINSRNGWKKK